MPAVDLSRVPAFYHNYIRQVADTDLMTAFEAHLTNLKSLLSGLPEEKWGYRYAEGKWTIRELVQHLIDAERIFAYRALTFARRDSNVLPGFDENSYVVHSRADQRSPDSLLEELEAVQRSSYLLFRSFDADQLESSGIANGNTIHVEAIGYIIIGHVRHHMNVLNERYGV
jgi:hypothetical protein